MHDGKIGNGPPNFCATPYKHGANQPGVVQGRSRKTHGPLWRVSGMNRADKNGPWLQKRTRSAYGFAKYVRHSRHHMQETRYGSSLLQHVFGQRPPPECCRRQHTMTRPPLQLDPCHYCVLGHFPLSRGKSPNSFGPAPISIRRMWYSLRLVPHNDGDAAGWAKSLLHSEEAFHDDLDLDCAAATAIVPASIDCAFLSRSVAVRRSVQQSCIITATPPRA